MARYWSVEEARAYLPRARQLIEALQRASPAATARGNGHGEVAEDRVAQAEEAAVDAAAELEQGGIVVRDLRTGLIDFPARGEDGVIYLLCWKLSDPDLGWWHLPEEGFAGRKPLPR
ncbi:MAG TPA: DUF2203 family protein [Acidimicrobiales bacterium]|nr:DUF2203 family protein [Acidimicrobiales bacterium]